MAIRNNLTEEFFKALDEIEIELLLLNIKRYSFFEKGLAYYIEYRKEDNTRVEVLFGPSDWDIEMIVYTSKGKFSFKDLLGIPEINIWVNNNRYKQESGRSVKNELFWFLELLKIALPMVE